MKKQIIQILVLIFILVTVWYLVWNNIDFLTTDKGKNICTTILALFLIVPVIYGYIKSSNTLAKYKKELIKMYGDDIKLNNFPQNDFEGFKNFKNIHFEAKIDKYNCIFRYYTFKRLEYNYIGGKGGNSYIPQYNAIEYIFNLDNQFTLVNENTILTVKDKFGHGLSAVIKGNNLIIKKYYSVNPNITNENILIDVKNIKELYENVFLEFISKCELSQIPNVEIDEISMKFMKKIEVLNQKLDWTQFRFPLILLIIVIIIAVVALCILL